MDINQYMREHPLYTDVPGPIMNQNQYSSVDYWYGPYNSLADVLSVIPRALRGLGLTVGVIEGGEVVEYQWKKGIEDSNLEKKIEDIISSAQLIVPSVLNYVESPGTIDFTVQYSSKAGGRITIYRNGSEIDHQNILPGANTYTVSVPEEFSNYVYSVTIKDVFGQDVELATSSFTIKVGSIKIKTDLQKQLDSEILGNSINTYVTVQNSGNPCHLYLVDENGVRTQIEGTNFNSYFLTIPLSLVSGEHRFTLVTYALNGDVEDTTDSDQIEFVYNRLDENINPYKITIDSVSESTTVERVTVAFHYQAYDSVQKQVKFIVDGNEITPETYFAAFAQCRYSLDPIKQAGNHTIKLKIENIESETVPFVVNQYEVDENIVPGAIFQFDPIQSESSGDYSLEYSGISEGVNGVDQENNLIKFSGESCAILKSNGRNLNPFTLNLNNGATLELLYNTKCIGNLNAPVMSTFQNANDNSLGVEVTYKQISVGLGGASRYTVDVSENTWIHATVVFSTIGFSDSAEETIRGGYMYIYINGCMVLVQPLQSLPSANRNAFLSLNVDNALLNYGESSVRVLRFYNSPLSPAQVVQNYINSISDAEEKEAARRRNQLDLPVVTFTEKLGTEYHFTDLLAQIDKSRQKKELVKCITEFRENSSAEPIIWNYTTIATQGTSTLQFPIKNFKIRIYNDDGYKNKKYVSFQSTEGWADEYVFTLKCDYMESSHLNNTPTCTFFNNMVDNLIEDNTDFADWTYDSASPARAGYTDTEGTYREYFDGQRNKRGYLDAIKGFPCVVKYIDLNNQEHYLGTYMFNLDKEAESLGFEACNKNDQGTIQESECVSIEGKSNTDEGAGSFCSFDYWLRNKSGYDPDTDTYNPNEGYYASEYNDYYLNDKNILAHTLSFNEFVQYFAIDNPGENFYMETGSVNKRHLISVNSQNSYYNQDFETRFIYNSDYETAPDHWHNWIEVVNFISQSYETVKDPNVTAAQIAEIKTQFQQYFGLNYCLLYYLQMITFAQVDNAGKNCMWDTWDGVKWYPRPYDLDTMSGLDNSGLEIIDPDVEYNIEGSPGNWYKNSASLTGASIQEDINESDIRVRRYTRFNTSGSRMWVLFKILFDTEIKNLYRRLRNNEIYDADNIVDFYFSKTSDIIGETYYNRDSVNKFIQPLGTETQYLDQLHGNRREKFKYWITNRIKFCDSLFEYNRTENELINLRINPSSISELVFKVYNPIYIHIIVGTNTGGGQEADVEYNFYCSPDSRYEDGKEGVKITVPVTSGDKEVSIFGASAIKEIEGLSNLNCKLINLSRAEKITTLELISLKNLTSLVLGSNHYLQTLIAEGLTGITNELDLTGASNIKDVSLRGSTFNNLNLTTEHTGTTVKTVNIANTAIQNLSIKQAPFLQTLNVDGCSLLGSLILDNCNIESLAFSSLPVLKTLNLINCKYLKSVNISELSYFELDTQNFSNCPQLEEIIMTGVYNVGNIKTLSLESITSLKTLNLNNTLGIERVLFDTSRLKTLRSLTLQNSQITRLDLPPASRLTTLNCYNCVNLTSITGLNANISAQQVFANCKTLASISGPYLKSSTALRMFVGCYLLNSLDIDTIDFSQSTSFEGTFSRCYKLPWSEIKKVLVCDNTVSAANIFAFKYHDPADTALGIVPADIFDGVPNINNLNCAFGYSFHSNDIYVQGHTVPSGYLAINTINTFNTTLDKVTNFNYFAGYSRITSIPNLSKFPNITSAQGAFMGCSQLTTVNSNTFASNTALTNLDGCFNGCTAITSNISNILDSLTALTSARGLFYNSGIKGVIPQGFFKNNHVLKDVSVMFSGSKITGLSPLFLNANDEVDGTYVLNNISAMFGNCTSLTGDIPEDLFTGCTTITNAGSFYGSLPNQSNVRQYGLFHNTAIQAVPQKLFDSLKDVTTAQGMFFNCKSATFPSVVDPSTYESTYQFLKTLTKVTNLNQMFSGCTEFKLPISNDFIPSTATQINGLFAFTGIPNIISLQNLTGLTTAIGAWANTQITEFPRENSKINLFKGLSSLTNVSYFFRGCVFLDDYIDAELFEDCTALANTSYMFASCESLGQERNAKSTLSEGLFSHNLNLESTAYMFNYCINLNGAIPDLFKNDNDEPYTKLYNINWMFGYANTDADENGYAFSEEFLDNLTSLVSAEFLFGGFNRTSGRAKSNVSYKLHEVVPFIKSSNFTRAQGMFSNSYLTGVIDNNLFRPAVYSLQNIKETFYNTQITSVGENFLIPTGLTFNQKMSNVANAFRATSRLTTNIPACNSKTIFTGIKNDTSTYQGYAYQSTAENIGSFSGMWVDGGMSVTIVSPGSHTKKTTLDSYTNQNAQIGL